MDRAERIVLSERDAVRVLELPENPPWRITFGWTEDDATDIDLEDYH